MDLPIKNCVFFHGYVSLPEGKYKSSHMHLPAVICHFFQVIYEPVGGEIFDQCVYASQRSPALLDVMSWLMVVFIFRLEDR